MAVIWNAVDAVDTKTNVALGFSSGILVLLAGFYSVNIDEWLLISHVLFGLATLAYIIIAALSILSYRIRDWSYKPEPRTFIEHCMNKEHTVAELKKWMADECESAIYKNIKGLNQKATLTNWVLAILALQTIFIIMGLVSTSFAN